MKIARTFTIDEHIYRELRRKPNQSRVVCNALKRYLDADEDFSIAEIPTKRLFAVLHARNDYPSHVKAVITHYLFEELTFS